MKTTTGMAVTIALVALLGAPTLVSAKSKPKADVAAAKEQKATAEAYARMSEVRPEHKRLEYFVGDWNASTQMWIDPKAPPQTSSGKSHNVAIYGGRYIEMHYEGTFMGQPMSGQGVFGYNNLRSGYFNTWIDSASTGFWLAYGTWNNSTNIYNFVGATDDPMNPGGKIRVRETISIVDLNHYMFEWYEMHGINEVKTMQIDYTRTSPTPAPAPAAAPLPAPTPAPKS